MRETKYENGMDDKTRGLHDVATVQLIDDWQWTPCQVFLTPFQMLTLRRLLMPFRSAVLFKSMAGNLSAGPQKADKDEETNKMDRELSETRIETDAIHVGQEPERWPGQAVVPPISMATTFKQLEPGKPVLYEYSRCGNPTRQCLEECLASLEKAKYALTFASGLGATTTLMFMLKSGDHIVSIDDVYGGTGRLFRFVIVGHHD